VLGVGFATISGADRWAGGGAVGFSVLLWLVWLRKRRAGVLQHGYKRAPGPARYYQVKDRGPLENPSLAR
jgi:hypothetical protein